MSQTEDLVAAVTEAVVRHMQEQGFAGTIGDRSIPVGVSNRHVHLSPEDLQRLFGVGFLLTKQKELSQPGQFACAETVTLVGPWGAIEKVRILGPVRRKTQVEISASDGFRLGVKAPVRDSGDLEGSAAVTLVGPVGSVTLQQGVILAARHIHMHPDEARAFGVKDKERLKVKSEGTRSLVFEEVLVRVNPEYRLEMHIDMDEANASGLKNQDRVAIVR